MVMGRWQDGVSSSGVSGLLRRRCEEEPVADGAGAVRRTQLLLGCGQRAPTCRRTLAVSSGKVRRSAKQAAVPAPRNFTAVVGGSSEGFSPTMVPEGSVPSLWGPVQVQGERLHCSPGL